MDVEHQDVCLDAVESPLVKSSAYDENQRTTDLPQKRSRCLPRCLFYSFVILGIILQVVGIGFWYTQYRAKLQPASAESTTPLPIDMTRTDGGIDLPQNVTSKHGDVDHVYIINLKSRTDRRDLMSILMQYAGLDVEFFPGTTPDTLGFVPGKEQRPESLSGAQLACWRSHMNVYQDIVTKGYRHALILEDDVDLEANTKDLLVEMIPRLPKDWDLFYAGRCGAVNTKDRVDNQSPSLLKFYKTGCTHGYMVSLRGARRLLYLLQKPTDAIDMMILSLAEHHSLQTFTTEPPWIAQVRRPDNPTNIPSSAAGRMWEGLRNSTRAVALANLGLS